MKRMSRKTKNLLVVIGIVLVASFLIVALGKVSSGFQDWDTDNWQLRKPNEDNLYQSLTFNLMDGSKDTIDPGTYGVTVKLNEDDNTIKVKGTADGDTTILIGTGVTLKANTSYLFDLGINNGSAKTIYMSVVNASTKGKTWILRHQIRYRNKILSVPKRFSSTVNYVTRLHSRNIVRKNKEPRQILGFLFLAEKERLELSRRV